MRYTKNAIGLRWRSWWRFADSAKWLLSTPAGRSADCLISGPSGMSFVLFGETDGLIEEDISRYGMGSVAALGWSG